MHKKKRGRKKRVPQRTCVGCRQVIAKRSLIRIVRCTDAVCIDPSGKLAGRGAYLHDRRSCWALALQGSLAHALKTELSDKDRRELLAYMETLPADLPVSEDETDG